MLSRAALLITTMPATRSSSRLKRPLSTTPEPPTPKKSKLSPTSSTTSSAVGAAVPPISVDSGLDSIPADAVLTFSFNDAKNHLITADGRFADVFARLPCRPFEELEQLHPFRALSSAILAQQISTLAARSIKHRFIRLYDREIPETYAEYTGSFFPTPQQVAQTPLTTLRTAGLSQRKAEYIHDLASRFEDGRLSTLKLVQSSDEELTELLIAVRGIGQVCVQLQFLYFIDDETVDRPVFCAAAKILNKLQTQWTCLLYSHFGDQTFCQSVSDLGVQRGLVRWFLAQHLPSYAFSVSPQKNDSASPKKRSKKAQKDSDDELPALNSQTEDHNARPSTPPPPEDSGSGAVPLPPTFTPSIQRTLKKTFIEKPPPPPLPAGLTVSELRSRLDGKKKVKGAFLSPEHMEQLTNPWRPYRSLGVFYMWALADAET
ncbi:DNA-3-methyladenine glycosidase [Mycena indigotica]|uniref:DNA-3-methyladenine glycosidase n=1 Tax=Mycena indigotica TaxID=2126181 RepID=A0A8H6TFH7_9AGAR|nr:DNA-3-methyladenine glycosidase [Mycena indigotica]KAF7315747.1 DNA-3-methyladenine glycosidase [Mycena indigotica]